MHTLKETFKQSTFQVWDGIMSLISHIDQMFASHKDCVTWVLVYLGIM
jgi:hypothetical protein